ncbi:MAG: cytosine deaminase-like protein, partial [Xanthobacteraceae bacterium]
MGFGFLALPDAADYVLQDATVPASLVAGNAPAEPRDGLVRADITVRDGTIGAVTAPGASTPGGLARVPLDGAMVFPCFVDAHTHLDKGHIWPRASNPDGTFPGALAAVGADRERNWS